MNEKCGLSRLGSSALTFVTCLALLSGCQSGTPNEQYKQFSLGGISPDGSRLSLTYCTTRPVCKFGMVNLSNANFIEITPPDSDHVYEPGGFSPDGNRLAVTVRKYSESGRIAQLGILDTNTFNLRQLTRSQSFKASPSFSHDGQKIIFTQANYERESGKTRFSDWDIYELKIEDAEPRRLTNFEFFQISAPAYLPDDQRFIFSGDSPHSYRSSSGHSGHDAYRSLFQGNSIFIRGISDSSTLTPAFSNGPFSDLPAISQDGKRIAYVARTDMIDGNRTGYTFDVFVFDGNTHKRLTVLRNAITGLTLSPDGKRAVIVVQPLEDLSVRQLWLINVETEQAMQLDPARLSSRRSAVEK